MKYWAVVFLSCLTVITNAQLKWKNVDSSFNPLPLNVHVFFSNDSLDGKPNIAYYISIPLKDKSLQFDVDTTLERRLTPSEFYEKNMHPLVTVNCTFFEFNHSKNLNTVIKNGKLIGYNTHAIVGKGKDTLTYKHSLSSAIGITKSRKVDVAWVYTDTAHKKPMAFQKVTKTFRDSNLVLNRRTFFKMIRSESDSFSYSKWKMKTAVGGGPILIQNGEIQITNEQELKFTGKSGLTDKHPRTCMGYTMDGRLIIMVVQGRFSNIAEGATLLQEAILLKNIGCWEALNLDGGGSSCLLINGKQTITPSDKQGTQRAIPCVFLVKQSQ